MDEQRGSEDEGRERVRLGTMEGLPERVRKSSFDISFE